MLTFDRDIMGTLNAIYVRVQSQADVAIAAMRSRLSAVKMIAGNEYVGVEQPANGFPAPEDELLQLSSELDTDVIWLSFQSAVDAFAFFHWRAGRCLRALVYGCFTEERTWERVEGNPEPWEGTVFFDEADLQRRLGYCEDEADKRELERIWRNRELMPGSMEPSLEARWCASDIAAFYGLPGWN